MCHYGCFCEDGLVRNAAGQCVNPNSCPSDASNDGLDCGSFDFCILRGYGNWVDANAMCEDEGMTLPFPLSTEENENLNNIGQTWLSLNLNQVLQASLPFNNWQRRQRGFMQPNGEWTSLDSRSELRPFFCIERNEECETSWWANMEISMEPGSWRWIVHVGRNFEETTLAQSYPVGTVLNFRCGASWVSS